MTDAARVKNMLSTSLFTASAQQEAKNWIDGLAAKVTAAQEEVDEFNAGYEAYKADLDLDTSEQMYRHLNADKPSHDQFAIGYAWAKFQKEQVTK